MECRIQNIIGKRKTRSATGANSEWWGGNNGKVGKSYDRTVEISISEVWLVRTWVLDAVGQRPMPSSR